MRNPFKKSPFTEDLDKTISEFSESIKEKLAEFTGGSEKNVSDLTKALATFKAASVMLDTACLKFDAAADVLVDLIDTYNQNTTPMDPEEFERIVREIFLTEMERAQENNKHLSPYRDDEALLEKASAVTLLRVLGDYYQAPKE